MFVIGAVAGGILVPRAQHFLAQDSCLDSGGAFDSATANCRQSTAPTLESPPVPMLTLQGVLLSGEFLGPPGYGEDPAKDEREVQPILQLAATAATQDTGYVKMDRQLREKADGFYFGLVILSDTMRARAKALVGRRVEILARPFAAETGHHRTPVMLQVQSVRPITDWRW
jgi:hypothetical protein